jgi:hypothetical protein
MANIMIDLFSGLGGASEAFVDAPEWSVIRIDNNPEVVEATKGTWQLDLKKPGEVIQVIDAHLYDLHVEKLVVWASPPCTDFSTKNPNRGAEEFDLALVRSAMVIIDHLHAQYGVHTWIIENVRGAIGHFDTLLGPYRQRIGPFFLWGSFVPIACIDSDTHRHKKPFNRTNSRTHLRSNIHAKVPYALSHSLLLSVERQTSLMGWVE